MWPVATLAFLGLLVVDLTTPLAPGSAIVEIEDYGTILLTVYGDGGMVSCTHQDRGAAAHQILNLTQIQGMAVLFGPRPPSATVQLHEGVELLEAWCPLPLFLNQ